MGIARGLAAPFRGAAFIARHRLWGYLVAPLLLNAAVAVGAGWSGLHLVRRLLGPGWLSGPSTLAQVASFLLSALVGVLVFIVVQPLVSAPFVDLLTERSEAVVKGHAPSPGMLSSLLRSIGHGLLKLVLYAGALAVTLGLGALTGFPAVFGAALYGAFLAYDGFDYPLARRGVSFFGKWRYLLLHPGQTVGYCCGASLLYFVPLAALVAPSFSAVGATLAYLDTEVAPDARRPGRDDDERKQAE